MICTGVALEVGVWYHLAWSLLASPPARLDLLVNGDVRRRVLVNSSGPWPLGRWEDARAAGLNRVELAVGRDPLARRQPGAAAVDELWLFGSALDRGDVRDLMAARVRKHAALGPGALDWFPDGVGRGEARVSGGADAPDAHRMHGAAGLADWGGPPACVKAEPYFWAEEAEGGRCRDDCGCCGARRCSEHGWCVGDAAPERNPDCGALNATAAAAAPPTCPPGSRPTCPDGTAAADGCAPWACGGSLPSDSGGGTGGDGMAGPAAGSDEAGAAADVWGGGAGRDYAADLLGLYDLAGLGLRSQQAGVTVAAD